MERSGVSGSPGRRAGMGRDPKAEGDIMESLKEDVGG